MYYLAWHLSYINSQLLTIVFAFSLSFATQFDLNMLNSEKTICQYFRFYKIPINNYIYLVI